MWRSQHFLLCSQLTLTDFRGSAWKARFTLQDVHDTLVGRLSLSAARLLHLLQGTARQSQAFGMLQEAYLPERDEDLLLWIQDAYCNGQPKLIKENGKLSGMEAKHKLNDLQVDVRCAQIEVILDCCSKGRDVQAAALEIWKVTPLALCLSLWNCRLRLPPSGKFEELNGQAALEEYHGQALQQQHCMGGLMQRFPHSLTAPCWQIHTYQTLLLLAASVLPVASQLCRAGIAISLCKRCEQAHARSHQLLEEKENLCTEVLLRAM